MCVAFGIRGREVTWKKVRVSARSRPGVDAAASANVAPQLAAAVRNLEQTTSI